MEGGVFGFREIVGEEFMTMLLPFFGHMVQRVVSTGLYFLRIYFSTSSYLYMVLQRY